MFDLFDPARLPIQVSPHMQTPAPWSALAFLYTPSDDFSGFLGEFRGPSLIVEPGYFTLAAAHNLAAAYHPHKQEPHDR